MASTDEVAGHPTASEPSSAAITICAAGACRGAVRSGNTLTCWGATSRRRRFPHVCVVGPDWPCNLISWTLIFGATLAFLVLVGPQLHWAVFAADCCTGAALVWALAVTAFSDAGYLPRQTPEQLEAQKFALTGGRDGSAGGAGGGGAAAAAGSSAIVDGAVVTVSALEGVDREAAGGGAGEGAAAPPLPPPAVRALTVCSVCLVLRERGTSHCYDCDRCVADLDHHCPWTVRRVWGAIRSKPHFGAHS